MTASVMQGGASASPELAASDWPSLVSSALSVIPSLPRPFLSRLVDRAIERLDEIDGDADLEDGRDDDEEDDPGGGNVEDEGEAAETEDAGGCGEHGIDQRELRWNGGGGRFD